VLARVLVGLTDIDENALAGIDPTLDQLRVN